MATVTNCEGCGRPLTDFEKRYGLTLCPSCYVQAKAEEIRPQEAADASSSQASLEPVITEQPYDDDLYAQYAYEPQRTNLLLTIVLLPFRVVAAIAAWILGVWLWLFFTAISIGIPVAVGIAIYYAVVGDNGRSKEEYFEDINPLLISVASATEDWTRLVDRHAEEGTSGKTREEILALLRDELEAANNGYIATRDALTDFRVVVPPKECQELHLATTEALQLTERGFLETKGYLEYVIRTETDDPEQYDRANDLLNEADRAKQQVLYDMEQSGCLR